MNLNNHTSTLTASNITFKSQEENELFHTIINAIADKKGNNIISLDLRNIEEAVTDFFIICDVDSGIQMRTIADHIEKNVRELLNEKPFQFELGPTWTLVDYISTVVHIFLEDERKFYDIESLWLDAEINEHKF